MWAFTNASSVNNTSDNDFIHNWYNAGVALVATGSPHNNLLVDNVAVPGTDWPPDAQRVIANAGIEPGLGTSPVASGS